MPGKRKRFNARFPPARIKKIMQTDEEIGKVAAAVPVVISRALELFLESLIQKSASRTRARNARTLTAAHIKQAIETEDDFSLLRQMVANLHTADQGQEEGGDESQNNGNHKRMRRSQSQVTNDKSDTDEDGASTDDALSDYEEEEEEDDGTPVSRDVREPNVSCNVLTHSSRAQSPPELPVANDNHTTANSEPALPLSFHGLLPPYHPSSSGHDES